MSKEKTSFEYRSVKELIPYARNARTHSDEQVQQIASSIKEFGFINPVIISADNGIIAGHGRVMAAQLLGLEKVPCIVESHLTEVQKRAYILADNRLAEKAGWDEELLQIELDDLRGLDFDLDLIGFSFDDIEEVFSDNEGPEENTRSEIDTEKYTQKAVTPQYEPTGEDVELYECVNNTKTLELIAEIDASNVTDEEKHFLRMAAARHTVFTYSKVAEYYANATPEMQRLMENSALVIIDYDDAIEKGFVKVTKRLEELRGNQA